MLKDKLNIEISNFNNYLYTTCKIRAKLCENPGHDWHTFDNPF